MTAYWGGAFGVIFAITAFVATEVVWVAALVGVVGMLIGHWLDPLTHIAPNSLETNKEEA